MVASGAGCRVTGGFFCSVPGSLLQPVCSQRVEATSTTLTGLAAETAKADLTQSSGAIGAPWQQATQETRTARPFAGQQLWVGKEGSGAALVRQKAVSRPSDSLRFDQGAASSHVPPF